MELLFELLNSFFCFLKSNNSNLVSPTNPLKQFRFFTHSSTKPALRALLGRHSVPFTVVVVQAGMVQSRFRLLEQCNQPEVSGHRGAELHELSGWEPFTARSSNLDSPCGRLAKRPIRRRRTLPHDPLNNEPPINLWPISVSSGLFRTTHTKHFKTNTNPAAVSHPKTGNYIYSIEKANNQCDEMNVTFCVSSVEEIEKCLDLAKVALVRKVGPFIRCLGKFTKEECIEEVKNQRADLINLSPFDFYNASR